MRADTRRLFDQYSQRVAQLNGVGSLAHTFAVEPAVQQRLEARLIESSAFLQAINMIGVPDLTGQKIGVGVSTTIAGRTDTSGNDERVPADPTDLTEQTYLCAKTNFDTALPYARLDAWARQPNFEILIRNAILERQALDRIMIGFNGTSVAPTTNRATHPLLQDVNKGWLQHYREQAPQRVMSNVKVGEKEEFKTLDAVVMDAVHNLIDPWHSRDPGLVVILGRDLVHDKYFPLVNSAQAPTEQVAADLILGSKRIGGLRPAEVPFMPPNSMLITSLANLSLYWQINARRRHVIEQPNKDRIANFESSNDAYVVEDFGLGCVVENIELVDDPAEGGEEANQDG